VSASANKHDLHDDLAGLDFMTPETSAEKRAVLRRSTRSDTTPSDGSRSNNRVGVIHDDHNLPYHSVKNSIPIADNCRGGETRESKTRVGIYGVEELQVTSLSTDDGDQPVNGQEQLTRRKSSTPEVPPRNVTALLRNKSKKLNEQTGSTNNQPVLLPKPAKFGRSVASNRSYMTTDEKPVDGQLPVVAVTDWKLEAERLQMRLTEVEKERDDARERTRELERLLALHRHDNQ
jgi:hypothetical protein